MKPSTRMVSTLCCNSSCCCIESTLLLDPKHVTKYAPFQSQAFNIISEPQQQRKQTRVWIVHRILGNGISSWIRHTNFALILHQVAVALVMTQVFTNKFCNTQNDIYLEIPTVNSLVRRSTHKVEGRHICHFKLHISFASQYSHFHRNLLCFFVWKSR